MDEESAGRVEPAGFRQTDSFQLLESPSSDHKERTVLMMGETGGSVSKASGH